MPGCTRFRPRSVTTAVVLLLMSSVSAPAANAAGPRTVVDLGALPGGLSSATALNDNGVVVGTSTTGTSTVLHAVRWNRSSRITDLGSVDGSDTYALGVNQRGTTFGFAENCALTSGSCSLRWSPDGTLHRLPALAPGAASHPQSINDHDVVVGSAGAPDGHGHPVRWTAGGQVVDLGLPPGAVDGTALGINNRGLIVGLADFADGWAHALLWDHDRGVIELPPAPGQVVSWALGVTEDGLIVGDVNTTGYHMARWQYRDGVIRPPEVLEADSYLYYTSRSGIAVAPGLRWDRSGRVTELKPLHQGGGSYPNAVNDAGIVVGSSGRPDGTATSVWWDRAGAPHEFPAPSPSPVIGVRAINEAGTVAGSAEFPAGRHAAVWR